MGIILFLRWGITISNLCSQHKRIQHERNITTFSVKFITCCKMLQISFTFKHALFSHLTGKLCLIKVIIFKLHNLIVKSKFFSESTSRVCYFLSFFICFFLSGWFHIIWHNFGTQLSNIITPVISPKLIIEIKFETDWYKRYSKLDEERQFSIRNLQCDEVTSDFTFS